MAKPKARVTHGMRSEAKRSDAKIVDKIRSVKKRTSTVFDLPVNVRDACSMHNFRSAMNATKIKQIMKLRGDVNAFASTIQARQKTQALFLLCLGFYGCDGDQFEEVAASLAENLKSERVKKEWIERRVKYFASRAVAAMERAPTTSLNADADDEYIRDRVGRIRARAKDAAKGEAWCDEEVQLATSGVKRYDEIMRSISAYRAKCEGAVPLEALLPPWLAAQMWRVCFGFATAHASNATIESVKRHVAEMWVWNAPAADQDTALANIEAALRGAFEASALEVKALRVFMRQTFIAADCMSYAKVLTADFVSDRGAGCTQANDWKDTYRFLNTMPEIELKNIFSVVMAKVYFLPNQTTLREKAIDAVARAFKTHRIPEEDIRTALEVSQNKFNTFLTNLLKNDYGLETDDFLAAGRPYFGELVMYAARELHTNAMNNLGQHMKRRFRQMARSVIMRLQEHRVYGGAFRNFLHNARNRRERLVTHLIWRFIHNMRANHPPESRGVYEEYSSTFREKYPVDEALEMTERLKTEVETFKLPADGGASLFDRNLRAEFPDFTDLDWWVILDFQWTKKLVFAPQREAPISAAAAFTAMSKTICERDVEEMRSRRGAPPEAEEYEKAIYRCAWEELTEAALSRELACFRRHGLRLDAHVGRLLPSERRRRVLKAAIKRVIIAAVRRELMAAGHECEFGEAAATVLLLREQGLPIVTCAQCATHDEDRAAVVDALANTLKGARATAPKPKLQILEETLAELDHIHSDLSVYVVDIVAGVAARVHRVMSDASVFNEAYLRAAKEAKVISEQRGAKKKKTHKNMVKSIRAVVDLFVSGEIEIQDFGSVLSPLMRGLNVMAAAPPAGLAAEAPAAPTPVTPTPPTRTQDVPKFWIMELSKDRCLPFPGSSLEYKFTRADRTFVQRTMTCVSRAIPGYHQQPFPFKFSSHDSVIPAGNYVLASIMPPSLLRLYGPHDKPTFSGSINVSRVETVISHEKRIMVPRDAESGLSFVDVTDIPLSQIVYVGIDPGINKPIASVIVAPDGHAGVGADVSFKCKFKDISAEDIETMREKQKRQQDTVARRENAAEQARAANTCPDEAIATAKSTYRVLNKKFSAKRNKDKSVHKLADDYVNEIIEFWKSNRNAGTEDDKPVIIIICGEEGIVKNRGWSQAPVSKYAPAGSAAMLMDEIKKIAERKAERIKVHVIFVPEYATSRDCPSCVVKLSAARSGRVAFPSESNTRLVRPGDRNGRVCTNPECNMALATHNRDHIGSINMLKKYRARLVEKLEEIGDDIEEVDIAERYRMAQGALESALTVFSLRNLETRAAGQEKVEEHAEEESFDSDDDQANAVDDRRAAEIFGELVRTLEDEAAGEAAETEARGVVRDRSGGGSRERADVIRVRTSPDYPRTRSRTRGDSGGDAAARRILEFDTT